MVDTLLQVLAPTAAELQLDTKRLNIRYFSSLTADATEGSTPTTADGRAASPPYIFSAASSRRLLSSESANVSDQRLEPLTVDTPAIPVEPTDTLKQFSPTGMHIGGPHMHHGVDALDLEDLYNRLEDHRSNRKLLQDNFVNTSATEFLWMDLNSDAMVNIEDSLLFADIIKLVDSDPALYCAWLQSVYSPSTATQPHSLFRGNSFTDASITGISSFAWQAVDPKLIYLRSNVSDVMHPAGVTCSASGGGGGSIAVPVLARFDGTVPLNQQEFLEIVPGAETSDPAGLFKAFFRPDEARDWRMYTVPPIPNILSFFRCMGSHRACPQRNHVSCF